MSTTFPGAIDVFVNPSATDNLNTGAVLHHLQHANVNDAVAAIESLLFNKTNMNLAASVLVPGATSLAIRDTANARNNLLLLNSGALTVVAQPGSGSGVAGSGHAFTTGAGGGGNANGGSFALTLGANTGTGASGQLTVASSSAAGQTAMADIHNLTHTFATLTGPYGGSSDQTRILAVTTETDASAFGYPGILNAFIARINVNTAAGATIGKVEGVSGVINIKAGSGGNLAAGGYATDGEILHNSTQAITGTLRAVQGSFQVNSSGTFATAYAGEFVITNTLGQTGTYTTLAQGVRGYVENNATVTYTAATGASGEVNHTAAGTVTGDAIGMLGWVHHSANVTYSGNVYGVSGLVQMSNTATNAGTVYSGQFLLQFTGSAVGGSTNSALNAEVQNSTALSTTQPMIGVNVRWRANNASLVQVNAIGINIMAPNFTAGATVTTGYGIRINDMSTAVGTVTTSYGLRIENQAAASASAYSFFVAGGRIQMSSTNGSALFTSASQALTISTTTSGTLSVTSAGLLTLTGVGASVWTPGAGATIVSDTVTGIKIGTATNQKLGLFNVTPVVQPTASTNANTPTAGSTTTVFTNTTFDGGVGGSAWTVGGLVAALKALGAIQA